MTQGTLWRICFSILVVSNLALARGGWTDPPGGWDYIYEADAGQAIYVERTGDQVTGLLDGTWMGGARSEFWDGSAPGVYSLTDAAGFAPGGVELDTQAGLGEDGGTATTLAIETVGDTTTAAGNPFNFAWTSPANQAIAFYHGTYVPGTTTTATIKGGMTVIARWRLRPNPTDTETLGGHNWRGQGFVTDAVLLGAGMISVVDQDDLNCSLSITDEGKLRLMDQTDLTLPGGNPTTFLSTWISVKLVSGTNTYRIEVFLNGSGTAAYAQDVTAPPNGDETGSSPDDYISFGLPVVNAPGALELDYIGYKIGFLRPGDTALPPTGLGCAINEAADPDSLTLTWTIPTDQVYDSIEILKGNTVVGTVLGTDTTWTTTDIERGQFTYGVRAIAGAKALLPTVCTVSYCPTGTANVVIDYTRNPPAARVTWTAPGYAVSSIQVSRNGSAFPTLAGTATEYLDTTLTPADGEVSYAVQFVPTAGAQCGSTTTRTIMIPRAERTYLEPTGGWDYVFAPVEHNPPTTTMDSYVAALGVTGNLDGTWIRSNQTDFWDGSKPGDTTAPDAVPRMAPGGIEILARPGEGLGGGDTKTLSIEDPGDPTGANPAYPDPSNRKIYLARLLRPDRDTVNGGALSGGITLYARFRLTPDAVDVANPPHGEAVRDGNRGNINLMYYDGRPADAAADNTSKSWGMSLFNDMLQLTDGGDLSGFIPGEWVSVWVTLDDQDGSGFYHNYLYINGDTDPIRPDWRSALDGWEEKIFVDTAVPFSALVIGFPTSGDAGAIEIDFLKVKYSPVAPQSGTAVLPVTGLTCSAAGRTVTLSWTNQDAAYDSIDVKEGATVRKTVAGTEEQAQLTSQADGDHTYTVVATKGGITAPGVQCTVTVTGGGDVVNVYTGDVNNNGSINIADPVYLLAYLFASGPPPPCMKAADANNDGKLNIADPTRVLSYLFAEGQLIAPDGTLLGAGAGADAACTAYDSTLVLVNIDGIPGCTTPCTP
jgi:hypothetical protein